MNANAQTFTPQSAKTPASTTLSDSTNSKNNGDSSAKAITSKTDATSSSKSNEKPPAHATQQQRRKQTSSTKKRFPTPATEASSSRHGATNQYHQRSHNSNHAAAKNKGKRHTQNQPQTSHQTEHLEMVETAQPQQSAADKKGRVSLNHLLSFSFPARQQQPAYTPRRHKPASYQPFNKERFVNANFRFVVKPSENYLSNIIDPDSSFEWDNIEQVLITGEKAMSCPICLSPPTAARVTKCGHTFCYNCILHYLELREPKKQWRKCPICWESIYVRDLKSVRTIYPFAVSRSTTSSTADNGLSPSAATQTNVVNVTEGDTVELCLMQRSSKSTLALPLSDTWPLDDSLINTHQHQNDPHSLTLMPWHFTPNVMLFGRFMLASPDYLLMENDRDIRELKAALKEAKEWGATEDLPFIETGLRQLGQDADTIGNMYTNKSLENAIEAAEQLLEQAKHHRRHHPREQQQQQEKDALSSTATMTNIDHLSPATPVNEDDVPEAYKQHHMQRAGTDDIHSSTTNESTLNPQPSQQQEEKHRQKQKHQPQQVSRQNPTTEFYFYQAKDGQHIYLHPLDIRILKYEYGDYQHFPPSLQVKAMGIEETTLTEDIRHRLRYIGHLPLSCDVTFIEIDIKPLVSKQTMSHFQGELKLRHKKRQDRIKREEKAIKKSAMMQQKRQVQETRREEQTRREDDPFFQTYQPMTMEENDRLLKEALEASALEAQQHQHQPKTVWGTPAVANNEGDQANSQPQEWADHIVITPGRRKAKGRRK